MHMGVNPLGVLVYWDATYVVPMHMGVNRTVPPSLNCGPTLSPCTWG